MSDAVRLPTPPTLAERARLFHALSDETRLAILEMLRGGERCVCDLQDALDAAQSRLSFHLKVLREAGLVRDRKESRWSYYALNSDRVGDIEAYARDLVASRPAASQPILHRIGRGRAPAAATPKADGSEDGCCR